MGRFILRTAAVAISLGVMAACGGGSSSGPPPIPPGIPTVTSVTPSVGILAGGTRVEVRTRDFSISFAAALPWVEFGGVPGTSVSFLSDTAVSVRTPAGAGTVDVVLTSADAAESAAFPGGFDYTAAPIVSGVSPGTGDPGGGELVTVVGDNFDSLGPVTVAFGPAWATGVSVQSSSVLSCFTPPNPAGPVTVTVTNPDTQSGSLADGYTYSSAPVPPAVSTVSPGVGDPAGGDLVTVTGDFFATAGTVTVTFGLTDATGVSVQDSATLTCFTPGAPPGPATVRVTNPDGGQGELIDGFIYTTGPLVTAVIPGSGDPAGGDPVTVTGDNFDLVGPVTVTFGVTDATGVSVLDAQTLTCLTPPGPLGPVTVTVTNPDARQDTLTDGFIYTAGPVVIGVAPGSGDVGGGESVTITGSNFATTGAVKVTFGLADGSGVAVLDSTTITCLTPAGPPGLVDVTVTNPGNDRGTLAGGFTYSAAPVVTAVSPGSGNPAGGDLVTIVGSDFDTLGTVTVTFGLNDAAGVTVIDSSTITCLTPPGTPGPVTVVVTNSGGRQGSLADGFSYTPDPIVIAVNPGTGDEAGGDLVTVTGDFFDQAGTVMVTFGLTDATGVSVQDPQTLTCTTPPGPAGPVIVTVTNPSGQQGSLVDGYTYTVAPPPAPTVAGVNPTSGAPGGGDLVIVTGDFFATAGTVTVTFGLTDATGVSVQDLQTLTCTTPPGPAGLVTVTVTNPDLQQGSLVDAFTYTGADPAVIAMEDQVFALINQERGAVGKAALTHDPAIRAVARAHSEDMRDRSFAGHVNPDGDDYGDRLTAAGIPFSASAEIIQWNLGSPDPAQGAFDWWLGSALHKSIMLDENSVGYTLAGVGCSTDGAGEWWFTVVFVRP